MFNKEVFDVMVTMMAIIEFVVSIGVLFTVTSPTEVLTVGVLLVNALLLIAYVPDW